MDRRQLRAVVLDLEGTTVALDFVYQVLYPYARSHVDGYVRTHLASEEVRADLRGLYGEHCEDQRSGRRPPAWKDELPALEVDSVARYVHWLMERDRDLPALRSLQGRIWEAGFLARDLSVDVYPDVPPALRRWHAAGLRVCSFSSASARAQRGIYGHSSAGDLAPLIDPYFDRTAGGRMEADTYRRIALALDLRPGAVLYLADGGGELDVAAAVGMKTLRCLRSGAESPGECRHAVVRGLDGALAG